MQAWPMCLLRCLVCCWSHPQPRTPEPWEPGGDTIQKALNYKLTRGSKEMQPSEQDGVFAAPQHEQRVIRPTPGLSASQTVSQSVIQPVHPSVFDSSQDYEARDIAENEP